MVIPTSTIDLATLVPGVARSLPGQDDQRFNVLLMHPGDRSELTAPGPLSDLKKASKPICDL